MSPTIPPPTMVCDITTLKFHTMALWIMTVKSGKWVPTFETKTLLSCYYPDDTGNMFFQNTGKNLPSYSIKTLKITKKLSALFLG